MSHNNGIIYIDTSVTPNKGVDFIADIAYVLGVSSGDIGYIITNGTINKWAKYKPVNVNTPAKITDAQRKSANQGFTISKLHSTAPSSLFELGMQESADWEYIHNSFPHYRALDFVPNSLSGNGYNANAIRPYAINGAEQTSSPDSHTWFKVQFAYRDGSIGIRLSDMAVFDLESGQALIYGVVFRKGTATGTTYYCPLYTSTDGTSYVVATDSFANNITGYFYADMGSLENKVTAYLCIAKVNQNTVLDYVLVPTGEDMEIEIVRPLAKSMLAWIPKVSNPSGYGSMRIFYSGNYLAALSFNFTLYLQDYQYLPSGTYTLEAYLRDSGGSSLLLYGSASVASSSFVPDTGTTGKANVTVNLMLQSGASVTLASLGTCLVSLKLTSGTYAAWFNLNSAAGNPIGPSTDENRQTMQAITTALGSANIDQISV